uniref:Uncharacterized protein n=1 Tax=Plectus sambesii TaxID=2011161 RepID=A0A914V2W8_9BILA
MRIDAELLLLAVWVAVGGCLDMLGHSVRVLIEACSVQQWHDGYAQRLTKEIATILNEECSQRPQHCHLRQWIPDKCSFYPQHIESALGYPRSIDDFTLELRLFVSHSLCCYRASDRWDPMVPRDTLIEFFHQHRKRLNDTGVKVLFIESIVPYYENLMRQWCFVCGLLGLFIVSVAIRLFIRSRQRSQVMADFWRRTEKRSQRTAAIDPALSRQNAGGTTKLSFDDALDSSEQDQMISGSSQIYSSNDDHDTVRSYGMWQNAMKRNELTEETRRRNVRRENSKARYIKNLKRSNSSVGDGDGRRVQAFLIFPMRSKQADHDGIDH